MGDGDNPMSVARRLSRPALPRRFYAAAAAGAHERGFAVLLDGKVARTPRKKALAVAVEAVAAAMAAEWAAQGEFVEPATMPLTRIVNAALDRVAGEMAAVSAEVVKYAGSDLLCYRAEGPQSLIDAQEAVWGPLLAWAAERLGARFRLAVGVVHVAQPPELLAAVGKAIAPLDPLALAAVHSAMTISGSAVIALALLEGRIRAEEAFAAANVDEDWQMARWGRDAAALGVREARWREMHAAGLVLASG